MERADAVTVPLMSPITSAGQHHAPMMAGMDNTSVKTEQIKPRRSDLRF